MATSVKGAPKFQSIGHCCLCSEYCAHTGGPYYCSEHKVVVDFSPRASYWANDPCQKTWKSEHSTISASYRQHRCDGSCVDSKRKDDHRCRYCKQYA